MSTHTVKHLCSYCGGWEQIKDNDPSAGWPYGNYSHATVNIDMPDLGLFRDVCIKCLVKGFDIVLGEPKK